MQNSNEVAGPRPGPNRALARTDAGPREGGALRFCAIQSGQVVVVVSAMQYWIWRGCVVVALSTGVAGCALDVSFSDSRYACDPFSGLCPLGFLCSQDGYCERAAPLPRVDAAPLAADADSDASDAAEPLDGGDPDGVVAPPDAALAPDASPPDAALAPDASPPDASPPDANTGPDTVSFVAVRDTQIHGGQQTLNFGGASQIVCNGNPDVPVLLGWNLSAIPTNATIDAAVMRVSTAGNALKGETASVFALLQDWTEGNLDGQSGVASYVQRKANASWATAGAKPPSRGSVAVATFAPTTPNSTYNVTLPISLVQAWVDAPAGNFGVVITCPFSNDVAFHTRTVSGKQPLLTVTYHL